MEDNEKLVTLIRKMYKGTDCKLYHKGQLSKHSNKTRLFIVPLLVFLPDVVWLIKETTTGRRTGMNTQAIIEEIGFCR